MDSILKIKGITKHFGRVEALNDVNIDVFKGEVLGIAGESGSGKTTLGRLILNLIQPDTGTISYSDKNIYEMSGDDLKFYRRDVQIVFQNPYTSLNPRMRIGEILAEPILINGERDQGKLIKAVLKLLKIVGLKGNFASKYPHELSGGERQRVGIARALSVNPKLIVLDEPVSSLDISIQSQILNLLRDLKLNYDLSYVFISHDLSVIKYLCDRVVILKDGCVEEVDKTDKLFSDPRSSYTKKLISSVPVLFSKDIQRG